MTCAVSRGEHAIELDQLLRGYPLLRGIAADELRALGACAVTRRTGEAFFRQGDPDDHSYGVVSGRVRIVKQSAEGREFILDVLGEGELVGTVAVIRRTVMPASAVALEPTVACRIPGDPFRALVARQEGLSQRLLGELSRRLLDANQSRLNLATQPVEVRLARVLLRLARRFGHEQEDAIVFNREFTRRNLADLAGTTVESAIRTVSRWTKQGLLRSEASRITVIDPEALRRIASDEDAGRPVG